MVIVRNQSCCDESYILLYSCSGIKIVTKPVRSVWGRLFCRWKKSHLRNRCLKTASRWPKLSLRVLPSLIHLPFAPIAITLSTPIMILWRDQRFIITVGPFEEESAFGSHTNWKHVTECKLYDQLQWSKAERVFQRCQPETIWKVPKPFRYDWLPLHCRKVTEGPSCLSRSQNEPGTRFNALHSSCEARLSKAASRFCSND